MSPAPVGGGKLIGTSPERLSYSDITRFEACRLRDHLGRVLRVGRVASDAHSSATRFGSAVHAALQICGAEVEPAVRRMEALARGFELDAERRAAMESAVRRFLGSGPAIELRNHDVVRREWGFTLMLGGRESFLFEGVIDAYGRSEDRGLIVDYKTGTSWQEDELRERYRKQAACYALAALYDGCTEVEAVFVRPEVVDSAGRIQEVRYLFTKDDAVAIEREIIDAHQRMKESDAAPLERWEAETCASCSFAAGLCPRSPRARS
jgi:RecB family exonuclease